MILTVNVTRDWGYDTTESFHFLTGLFDFLDDTKSSATLFIISEVAEKLREIGIPKKVEVASLSTSERDMRKLDENGLAEDLIASKKQIESMLGRKVFGFRAPMFRSPPNLWGTLKLTGYTYSSSLVSGRRVPHSPFKVGEVVEFPILRKLLKPFGLPFLRIVWPFSKILKATPYLFYYSLTELLGRRPGPSWHPLRRALGIHGGMKARRILYEFLERNAPTQSISKFLLGDLSFKEFPEDHFMPKKKE